MAPSSESSYIPFDLLFIILSLLTVKTLKKLRCVCKSWKEVIDSTSFLAHHLSLQTQNPHILIYKQLPNLNYYIMDSQNHRLFYHTLTAPQEITFPANPPVNLQPVATVDGVICLYSFQSRLLVLWNPSIHCHFIIPLPVICRTFDKDDHYCGFWMDSSAKHFKVVIFCVDSKRIILYSSKKKEWAQSAMRLRCDYYCQSPQVLIDSVAYWTAHSFYSSRGHPVSIAFYDFGKDEFGKIDKLPEVKNNDRHCWRLNAFVSKWRGSMAVVYSRECFFAPYVDCDIWVMKQNGSWSNLFSFLAIGSVSRVLSVMEVEDQKARVLGSNRHGELGVYDPEHEEEFIRVVSKENKECLAIRSFDVEFSVAYEFVESFVIPDRTW